MRWFNIFMCGLILLSCVKESCIEHTPVHTTPKFTDSIFFAEYNLTILFNDQNLFDTTYDYMHSSCTYSIQGKKLSNSKLDSLFSFSTDWYMRPPSTVLNLTIFPSKKQCHESAGYEYLSFLYYRTKANRSAIKKTVQPTFGDTREFNGNRFSFIAFTDTVVTSDSILSTEIYLNAVTFYNATKLEFRFNFRGQNGEEKLDEFYDVLKSITIK